MAFCGSQTSHSVQHFLGNSVTETLNVMIEVCGTEAIEAAQVIIGVQRACETISVVYASCSHPAG